MHALLLVWLVSLPISEALKNISGVLIIVIGGLAWIVKHHVGTTNRWFVMSVAILGLTILVAGQSFNENSNWHIVQNGGYLLVALVLHCIPRERTEIHQALAASILGSCIAVLVSYFDESRSVSQLPSVGFYVQSNIYLALSLGIAITFLLKTVRARNQVIVAFVAVSVCLGFSDLLNSSIGQFISLIGLISILLASSDRTIRSFLLVILLVLGLLSTWLATSAESAEFLQMLFTERLKLWSYVSKLAAENIWTGLGVGQYNESDPILGASNHAHSLYLNVFVERGLIGLIGLTGFTVLVVVAIRSISSSDGYGEICWFILFFTLLVGLFQTTLHLEHGALVLTILALVLRTSDPYEKMKLSMYSFGNKHVPSTRFRLIQYMDLFAMNFEATVKSEKVRISNLIGSQNEICFIQKQLPAIHKILIALCFRKARWVFDYDDAIWEPVDKHWSSYTKFRQRARFDLITLCSDKVFVSSRYLARFSRCSNTSVVPVGTPLNSDFSNKGSKFQDKWDKPLIFGWAGKASSAYQLNELKRHLSSALFDENNFIVLSGEPPDLDFNYRFLPFTEKNEKLFFELVHIGIVPSTKSLFDAGKTPVKALQHFSYGATVLSNPHGAGAEFITSETAFIYENDFGKQVEFIMANANLAKEKAVKGYILHSQMYCSQAVGGMLVQGLKSMREQR